MSRTKTRVVLTVTLVCTLIAGVALTFFDPWRTERIHVVAHFANTNGLYVGDQVRIMGVPVGEIDSITPGPDGAEVAFSYDAKYRVPAQAEAAILSPGLVSARVIQLTPPYTDGPVMADHARITIDRTAVPAEYDDLRQQLEKLNESLQPTEPGGVSPAGAAITTAADNLRGQGADIRKTLIELSEAMSALGDHSGDITGTVKSLSVLVSALQSSRDVLTQLNENLSAVTGMVAGDPQALANAVRDLDVALADIQGFLADNQESIGTSVDKITSISTVIQTAMPDLKQILHIAPNALSNFAAAYRPHTASVAGTFAVNSFANPLQFLCGAIQAASRLNYERSAKLCVQYMAPILKNRQFNFPPIGTTIGLLGGLPVAGVLARPNEITHSEDWMRPDHLPPPGPQAPPAAGPLPAEAPAATVPGGGP